MEVNIGNPKLYNEGSESVIREINFFSLLKKSSGNFGSSRSGDFISYIQWPKKHNQFTKVG